MTPADPVTRELANALETGRAADVPRILAEALSHGIIPDGADLPRWLIQRMGKAATLKLVAAHAGSPCFHCRDGLDRCDACEGRGHIDDGDLCERCAALGATCCDFCSGSGLVTYDAIPAGLRVLVAVHRMRSAAGKLNAYLKKPVPGSAESERLNDLTVAAKALLNLNRLMGVFENGLLFAGNSSQSDLKARAMLAHAARAGVKHAAACRSRMREILGNMANSARSRAESRPHESKERETWRKRAAFYDSLLKRPGVFAGTGLQHPFLEKAIRRLSGTPSSNESQGTKPARSAEPDSAQGAR